MISLVSSPEHEVTSPCVRSRGHILSPILMKLDQNVCPEFRTSLKLGQKLGHLKTLCTH